jgi:hypothetical protein
MRMADAQSLPYLFEPYVQVLGAGLQTLTKSAGQAQLTIDPALGNAIGNFGNAARAYDTSPQSRNDALALNVAQQLDLLAYSANGYASVAFPAVATAIATGHQSAVDTSVHTTVTTLNVVTALLTGKK